MHEPVCHVVWISNPQVLFGQRSQSRFHHVRAAAQYHLQVTRVTFSGLLNALDGVIATEAHMGKPRHCSGELR